MDQLRIGPGRRRTHWRKVVRNQRFWLGLIVLVPTMLWYIVLQAGPILEAIWFSVFHVDLANMSSWLYIFQTSQFVGLLRFQHLFDPAYNPEFWPGTVHSIVWTVLQFIYVLPLALLLALSLAKITRGRALYQIALLVPVVTPMVAVALLMGKAFDPDTGAVNTMLHAVGLPTSQWLHNPVLALPLAAAISAWRWLGFYVIILTAGLLSIPKDVQDAALIDGAGVWGRFRFLTLPLLGHAMTLVCVLLLVNSMQEFTLPYTLAGGWQQFDPGVAQPIDYGPNSALVLLNLALYKQAFGGLFVAVGPASAGAVLELGFVLIGSLALLKLLRPKWTY